jgi:hypothetical protein
MKAFYLVLQLAILESAALVDTSVLAVGNTWEYELKRTYGYADDVAFFGKTSVVIDSLRDWNGLSYIWSSWKDSSYATGDGKAHQSVHYIYNGKLTQVSGNPEYYEAPFFLMGSGMSDSLSTVRFADKTRLLNKWTRYPPPMSFGETKSGAYLQGVGTIAYKTKSFSSLNHDGTSIRLLEYNGIAFDSTKMEFLGPLPLAAEKLRKVPAAKSRTPISWKGNVHGITGRRLY